MSEKFLNSSVLGQPSDIVKNVNISKKFPNKYKLHGCMQILVSFSFC